jgi:catechol 2,3-dioxygenase-like lactoylglutathione lyase family enzyme
MAFLPAEYPRVINHVGLNVRDLDKVVEWYKNTLGFTVILGPVTIEADDSPNGKLATDIYGPEFKRMRIAWMDTGNGVGFELFEFQEPEVKRPEKEFDFTRFSFTHISITDPNIEELAARIVETGGKLITSRVWESPEGSGYKVVHCLDPFGNYIEILSNSFERTLSNWDKLAAMPAKE